MGIKLCGGSGGPSIYYDAVIFYGDGEKDLSHETFYFSRIDGNGFYFCKTAEKPYDLAVTSFLIIAKHYLKDSLSFDSDGLDED